MTQAKSGCFPILRHAYAVSRSCDVVGQKAKKGQKVQEEFLGQRLVFGRKMSSGVLIINSRHAICRCAPAGTQSDDVVQTGEAMFMRDTMCGRQDDGSIIVEQTWNHSSCGLQV